MLESQRISLGLIFPSLVLLWNSSLNSCVGAPFADMVIHQTFLGKGLPTQIAARYARFGKVVSSDMAIDAVLSESTIVTLCAAKWQFLIMMVFLMLYNMYFRYHSWTLGTRNLFVNICCFVNSPFVKFDMSFNLGPVRTSTAAKVRVVLRMYSQ